MKKHKVKNFQAQIKCAGGCGAVLRASNLEPVELKYWKCINCDARFKRIRHRLVSSGLY
jgi:hypothetical protein